MSMKICGSTWCAIHGEVFPGSYYSYESKWLFSCPGRLCSQGRICCAVSILGKGEDGGAFGFRDPRESEAL